MVALRYTLLGDGRSDDVLMPIIEWLFQDLGIVSPIQGEWADLSNIQSKVLSERIGHALDRFPCDLLFVHRDAENQPRQMRLDEIQKAVNQLQKTVDEYNGTPFDVVLNHIPVIPIRMTEAWLLISEDAIRAAAMNRNGSIPLNMPPIQRLEDLPDPKQKLHEILRIASEKKRRRLKEFNPRLSAREITREIIDFSPLRKLSSFRALEDDLRRWLDRDGEKWL
jgi:hypothetical protein